MSDTASDCLPRHVAIIMDGNGRWAKARGLSRIEGHRAGAEAVQRVMEACSDLGIEYLTLYAFSTENWRRPPTEVAQLMRLLARSLDDRLADLEKHRIRLRAIGELHRLPGYVRRRLEQIMEHTEGFEKGVLTLALSYGSRAEIVGAARRLAERVQAGEMSPDEITEESFSRYLYTADMPPPDMIIRTSNEKRLSNFLLWQASYAELCFMDTYWPDFGREQLLEAVAEFSRRHRCFGGLRDA